MIRPRYLPPKAKPRPCWHMARLSSPMTCSTKSKKAAGVARPARDRGHGLAGCRLEGAPEICGRGIAVGVLLHVGADAGPEDVVAEIVFHHPNDRLPLRIGDGIKRCHRLGFVCDRLLDRMGRAAGVFAHGRLLEAAGAEPSLPIWMKLLGGLSLHPAREAFVEPDVVPPCHGDEIAEPLMRHFMGDDVEDAALRVVRAGGRIEQHAALEKRDAAPVLHGAAEAARHRDQVELGKRISDAEIFIVVAQETDCSLERVAAMLTLT